MKRILELQPDDPRLSNLEIMAKYPALENIPDSYIGVESYDAGIVRAKRSLETAQWLATKYGAELKYSAQAEKITKNEILLVDGSVIKAKDVVVTCGRETLERKFDTNDE